MKAKSRRRLLISSVAMLLVAMLALGTATFAWFTTSTDPWADGINVRATKVSTLLVSDHTKAWATHVNYNVGASSALKKMFPASSADGTNWFTGNTNNAATGAIDTTTLARIPSDDTGTSKRSDFLFEEEFNIKNDGQLEVTDITVTIANLPTSVPYAAMALVSVADGTDANVKTGAGTFGVIPAAYSADSNPDYSVYGGVHQGASESYYPIKADGSGAATTAINSSAATTIKVPDLDAGEMAYYKLYVWFEGQDAQCINANSGQEVPNLSLTVSGTVASD